MSDRLKNALCILVSAAWVIAVVVMPIVRDGYKADPAINIAFTGVIGIMLTSASKDKDPK